MRRIRKLGFAIDGSGVFLDVNIATGNEASFVIGFVLPVEEDGNVDLEGTGVTGLWNLVRSYDRNFAARQSQNDCYNFFDRNKRIKIIEEKKMTCLKNSSRSGELTGVLGVEIHLGRVLGLVLGGMDVQISGVIEGRFLKEVFRVRFQAKFNGDVELFEIYFDRQFVNDLGVD